MADNMLSASTEATTDHVPVSAPRRHKSEGHRSSSPSNFLSSPNLDRSGFIRSATLGPGSRTVDTSYKGHANGRRSIKFSNDFRTSIMHRLSSIRSPTLGGPFTPRQERYSRLHEMDDFQKEDVCLVDISFLEGPSLSPHDNGRSGTLENEPLSTQRSESQPEGNEASVITSTSGLLSPAPNLVVPLSPRTNRGSRPASLREYGQRLADETNMIVSVREVSPAVDLSSLEGRGSTAEEEEPDSARFKKAGTTLADSSFYFPTDPEQPDWKPFSLRSYYIAMLTVLSLVLAGVQEYLYQRSHRLEKDGGGLVSFHNVEEVSTLLFFCWKYLPTMVMVIYGVLWQITDFEVKRLEPYYQLSQRAGNTAAQSLNLDYVTIWSLTVPIKAFKFKHWAVFVSSVASILATTAAPSLQSPSIDSVENPQCKDLGIACDGEFRYFIRVKSAWSRLVTACLILVAVLSIVLLIQLRRKSGLLSDPHGVAGIAAMATKSHILRDFDGMDEALHDDIHEKLRHRRYVLYKSTIWQGECTEDELSTAPPTSSRAEKPLKPPNPNPILLRPPFLMAFMISMAVFLPFIPAIAFTNLNVLARKLPWLPVLLATLIKQLWTSLEFNVKLLQPFRTLAAGPAPASQTLTLDYRGTPYGLLPVQALLNRHSLVALVGTGSILADILTITLASLALTAGSESPLSFIASSILSITIVTLLIAIAFLVFLRYRHPFMPRQPATIASILAFVYQSRMLDDFVGTECYSHARMQELLAVKDKRYALGWFKGRNNRPHCAIDEEPILSRYVHGVSYRQAQAPWEENVGF